MTSKVPSPLDFASLNLQPFDVRSLAEELLDSAGAAQDGRSSRTLAKSKALTVVLTVLRAGHTLEEHAASGPVTVVALSGAVTFSSPQESTSAAVLSPGHILMMGGGEKHRVRADEDSTFLIIIGARP
jgi:quercetin dioxygenase-like cupin family protein